MERSLVLTPLMDAVDRPAHAALALGRRGFLPTLGQAGLGLFGVALATTATQLLLGGGLEARVDGLRAFMEVSALLVPIALLAAFLQVGVPLRTLLGAMAVGLLQAGVVALAMLPLVAFVAVVSDVESMRLVFPGIHALMASLAIPMLALLTLLERTAGVVRNLDGRHWVGRAIGLLSWSLAIAFLARAWQLI